MRKIILEHTMRKLYNLAVGLMGLITIPLLAYSLYISPATDKIVALSELVTVLLLFGTFMQLVRDGVPFKKRNKRTYK
jgi:hypothetical protein